MTLYDLATDMVDKRLPQFAGAGITREGGPVPFGRGRGKFFLSQSLTVKKLNGKWVVTNEPFVEAR